MLSLVGRWLFLRHRRNSKKRGKHHDQSEDNQETAQRLFATRHVIACPHPGVQLRCAFGVIHEADERAAAHIWQILMVMQIPIIAFFALKYVPQRPKQAFLVFMLQIGAALAACAPVFFLKL